MEVITLTLDADKASASLYRGAAEAPLCERGHLIQPSVIVNVRAIRRLEESPRTIWGEEFGELPLAVSTQLKKTDACNWWTGGIYPGFTEQEKKAIRMSCCSRHPQIWGILERWAVYIVPSALKEEVYKIIGVDGIFAMQYEHQAIIIAGKPINLNEGKDECSFCMVEDALESLDTIQFHVQDDLFIREIKDVPARWSSPNTTGEWFDHSWASSIDAPGYVNSAEVYETDTLYRARVAHKVIGNTEAVKIETAYHPTVELPAGIWLLTHPLCDNGKC